MKHAFFQIEVDTADQISCLTETRLEGAVGEERLVEAKGRDGQASDVADYIDAAPCFTPESEILTDRGPVAAKLLKVGDRVMTRDHGLQTVRRIGRRQFGWRALGLIPLLRPVVIEAGALGHGLPARQIILSPEHGIASASADGLGIQIVQAKRYVGTAGVERGAFHNVTYIQIGLDQPALVNVSGLWCETLAHARAEVAVTSTPAVGAGAAPAKAADAESKVSVAA
ncbi:Hint domain-containing protein [Frigidibacter sp. RF13]|uniref:Hint domain-containing protein n=1 Tax=Frigidibacter sp. RF13 TaxID=2997340 RepID=UPI0022700737|nr:Hint domain-containing protein [Frigidibacter sp. RF13]MCY1125416.1 Hint domain-containing protein [Frigidibacter sp. RF13]